MEVSVHIPGLRPPTAKLSEQEAYERMEELRAIGVSRHGPVQVYKATEPEFKEFARDWQRTMVREQ